MLHRYFTLSIISISILFFFKKKILFIGSGLASVITRLSRLTNHNQPQPILRGSNYCDAEEKILLRICNKYSSILENKNTGAVPSAEKSKAWEEIETKFNADALGPHRNKESLNNKYDAIKKRLRKQIATQKTYDNGTGGGPRKSRVKMTEEEETLYQSIRLSAEGLTNWYGTDVEAVNIPEYSRNALEEQRVENSMITSDWAQFSSKMLQTKKNSALKKTNDDEQNASHSTSKDTQIVYDENVGVITCNVSSNEMVTVHEKTPNPTSIANKEAACAEIMMVDYVIPKKPVGHKANKSKPFEELAILKRKLVEKELRIVEMKEIHLKEMFALEHAQKVEEHSWKKKKWDLELQILQKKLEQSTEVVDNLVD